MRTLVLFVFSAVTVVTGCDKTNWESSIFRDALGKNDGVDYVATDAKQRLLLTTPNYRRRFNTEPPRIICAEPSPDVAQALSEALKFTASVSVQGQGSGSTGLDRSFSHSVAQLGERLAVIQLLRDKMYRACEAYANGAVQASGYTLMLARLDKTMMSLLSAEMVAGAFGRGLANLGGSAGTGGVDPKALQDAEDKVVAATEKLTAEGKKADNEEKIDEAAEELSAAQAALFALQYANARSFAGASLSNASFGKIEGRTGGTDATIPGSIATIHRNYIDDHGLDPLVDACVVAMDAVKFSGNDLVQFNKALTDVETATEEEINAQNTAKSNVGSTSAAEVKNAEKAVAGKHDELVKLLASKSAFAAFCANRIFSYSDHQHSFIRQFTTLKRDLRGARVTSPDESGKVIAEPVGGVSDEMKKAIIEEYKREQEIAACKKLQAALVSTIQDDGTASADKEDVKKYKECADLLK